MRKIKQGFFFSEEKKQKTFVSGARGWKRDMAGKSRFAPGIFRGVVFPRAKLLLIIQHGFSDVGLTPEHVPRDAASTLHQR
jgi:hypothetical protein